MILLIDNYDSFSYNLYQLIGSINSNIKVIRNDELAVEEIRKLSPQQIVLSPGPKKPEDAGICIEIVKKLGCEIPILGVCLGHQSICRAYGGEVSYAKHLMHGKQSLISVDSSDLLFKGLTDKIPVARYHSLSAVKEKLPDVLKITAESDDGEIMAVSHKEYSVYGVQFHPESIMTPAGKKIIENFLGGNSND